MTGPLAGLHVLELGGIGPVPFCGMLLADMGADVIRIDRVSAVTAELSLPEADLLHRGKRSVAVDLKHQAAKDVVLEITDDVDALIEGFRPGVAERLGLGPTTCCGRNASLVYGRMTGWGQNGPYAGLAGHDINYIAVAGALESIGPSDRPPPPPLNLIADFGAGGMLLAFGLVCALFEARTSGQGQVIDAAMIDGAALLTTVFYGWRAAGLWRDDREANTLDGGAHYYGTYETADGKYVAVGAIEPPFYESLLRGLGLSSEPLPPQDDRSQWPALRDRFREIFKARTQDEWCQILAGVDGCFAPVLSWADAPLDPHNAERGTFVNVAGIVQPAPAPRFSRTPGAVSRPPVVAGRHTTSVLKEFGIDESRIEDLRSMGAIAVP